MPRVVLARGVSYKAGPYVLRRGGPPVEVPEQLYAAMMRTGYVADPDKLFSYIQPRALDRLPNASVVPVLRDVGLGDVFMASLGVRALTQKYPHLRFVFAVQTPYVPLFRDYTCFDTVSYPNLRGSFPAVINLIGYSERAANLRTVDRIDLFAEYLGVTIQDYTYPYQVTYTEQCDARDLLKNLQRPLLGVAIRGAAAPRTYPYDLVRQLTVDAVQAGWNVVLLDYDASVGFEGDGVLNLCGQTWMVRLAAILSELDVVVAPDTGVVHLAEVVKTKCVALYSTIPPHLRLSHYQHVDVIWNPQAATCVPCFDAPSCGGHYPCLRSITPEQILVRAAALSQVKPSARSVTVKLDDKTPESSVVCSVPSG